MKSILLIILLSSCSSRYDGPPSDHFDGKRFFHSYGEPVKGFWSLLYWKIFEPGDSWPSMLPETSAMPLSLDSEGAQYISHATILVNLDGVRILTDPHWGERASPVSFAGPKRVKAPPVSLSSLQRVDGVVVSHNHYDHLDVATLLALQTAYAPRFFVPLGDKGWLEAEGLRNVTEMDWGQTLELYGINVTFLPVRHWSARGLFDRNMSLWGGYLLQGTQKKVYFAGDTGYFSGFKDLSHQKIDLAVLPIGAYEPRWFMESVHLNPDDAVKAHLDLQAVKSLGMHYGHWQLTNESIDQPAKDLDVALKKYNVSSTDFLRVEPGSTLSF